MQMESNKTRKLNTPMYKMIGDKVTTPLGKGTIVGNVIPDGFLVMYSRKDYSVEDWKKISPGNGPCVYRTFGVSEVTKANE